jgi:hypothetical protein
LEPEGADGAELAIRQPRAAPPRVDDVVREE